MDPKLTVVQIDTIPCEVNYNVHKGMNWTKRAFDEGANYVFLHEGLTADYTPDPMKYGRPLESPEVFGFVQLAKDYGGYVALGLNEVLDDEAYISTVWIGPDGVIGVYRKSYLWPNQPEDKLDEWLKTYVPHQRGYRCEQRVLGRGDGTVVIQVGDLRIGCLICADGDIDEAWETFAKEKPDLIFWQNNRESVIGRGDAQGRAKDLGIPLVGSNRCGFSYKHFLLGGSCFIADTGEVVLQSNEEGKEEMISANLSELQTSSELGTRNSE